MRWFQELEQLAAHASALARDAHLHGAFALSATGPTVLDIGVRIHARPPAQCEACVALNLEIGRAHV